MSCLDVGSLDEVAGVLPGYWFTRRGCWCLAWMLVHQTKLQQAPRKKCVVVLAKCGPLSDT